MHPFDQFLRSALTAYWPAAAMQHFDCGHAQGVMAYYPQFWYYFEWGISGFQGSNGRECVSTHKIGFRSKIFARHEIQDIVLRCWQTQNIVIWYSCNWFHVRSPYGDRLLPTGEEIRIAHALFGLYLWSAGLLRPDGGQLLIFSFS